MCEAPAGRVQGPDPSASRVMRPDLPPPDPYESLELEPSGVPLPAPIALFLGGSPSARAERLSDAILDARPGALIVVGWQ